MPWLWWGSAFKGDHISARIARYSTLRAVTVDPVMSRSGHRWHRHLRQLHGWACAAVALVAARLLARRWRRQCAAGGAANMRCWRWRRYAAGGSGGAAAGGGGDQLLAATRDQLLAVAVAISCSWRRQRRWHCWRRRPASGGPAGCCWSARCRHFGSAHHRFRVCLSPKKSDETFFRAGKGPMGGVRPLGNGPALPGELVRGC